MSQSKHRNRSEPDGASGPLDPSHAPDIWDRVLDDLSHQMAADTFHAHLSASRPRLWQPEDNTWVIEVRGRHSPAWLKHRLDRVVRRVVAQHTAGLPEPRLVYLAPDGGDRAARESAAPADDEPVHDPIATPAAAPGPGEEKPGKSRSSTGRRRKTVSGDGSKEPEAGRQETTVWKASLQPTDIYIKFKTSFRDRALRRLKGARLSVFMSLALHIDQDGTAAPGVERIMRETGLARGTVCRALDELGSPPLSLIEKVPVPPEKRPRGCIRMPNCYRVRGYAWWGAKPAPALYEEGPAME